MIYNNSKIVVNLIDKDLFFNNFMVGVITMSCIKGL